MAARGIGLHAHHSAGLGFHKGDRSIDSGLLGLGEFGLVPIKQLCVRPGVAKVLPTSRGHAQVGDVYILDSEVGGDACQGAISPPTISPSYPTLLHGNPGLGQFHSPPARVIAVGGVPRVAPVNIRNEAGHRYSKVLVEDSIHLGRFQSNRPAPFERDRNAG